MDQPSSKQLTSEQAISEIGKYMLQGWTLLAESCPLCSITPLVERKKDQTIKCVRCGVSFLRQPPADSDSELSFVPISPQPTVTQNNSATNVVNNTPTTTPITSTNSDAAKQIMPTKEEGVTPTQYENTDEGDQEMYEARQNTRTTKLDGITKKMGDYLLRGWAMLQDACPQCNVPLMRKDGKMFCVSCERTVIKADEYDPSKHKIDSPKQQELVEKAASKRELPTQTPVSSAITPQPQPVPPLDYKPSAPSIGSYENIIHVSLDSLYDKMYDSQKRLKVAPIQESINLCTLITECAKAIKQLEEIATTR